MVPDTPVGRGPVVEFEHPGVGRIELHGEFEDEYIFGLIRQERKFYESELLWLLERMDIRGGLAVDAGAHIGNHTVFFAKVLGLETLSIEPRPESAALLRTNVEANDLDDLVTVVQAVLGSEPGRAHLEQAIEQNTGSVVAHDDQEGEAQVVRLDDLVDQRVVVLKIDVEGAEPAVLAGARSLLDDHRPLVCVEAHNGEALEAIDDILAPLDYQPIAIAGRSDNYVFAASSPNASVDFEIARARAAVLMDRRRDQVIRTAVRDLKAQLSGVRAQTNRLDALDKRFDAVTRDLGEVQEAVVSRARERIELLELEVAERDRRIARWKKEYRRVTNSRALRSSNRLRSFLAKVGLATKIRILTPEEIEDSIDGHT